MVVIKFLYKYKVTKIAINFGEYRMTICQWRKIYDGLKKFEKCITYIEKIEIKEEI